jgi:hypothetical protein
MARRVDELARLAAGEAAPRRATLKLFAGAALAVALGRVGGEEMDVSARRKKRCPAERRCAGGCCAAGEVCIFDVCASEGDGPPDGPPGDPPPF